MREKNIDIFRLLCPQGNHKWGISRIGDHKKFDIESETEVLSRDLYMTVFAKHSLENNLLLRESAYVARSTKK